MAMRNKTAKEMAQKRAAIKTRKEAAKNYTDDMSRVDFGVLRIHGEDRVVLFGDPASNGESYDQNTRTFAELLKSVPQDQVNVVGGVYWNVFVLYEDGHAHNRMSFKDGINPEYKAWCDATTQHFMTLVEAEYDKVFPHVAAQMKQHAEKWLHDISATTTVPVAVPEGATINPEYWVSLIRNYMEKAKKQLIETGEAGGIFGWGIDEGTFLCNSDLPTQKYRFARTISEIASVINAPFIVHGSEVWVHDPKTSKRTGDEGVCVNVILPDGTVGAQGYMQFRRIDCPLKVEETVVQVADKTKRDWKQFLFPQWAYMPIPVKAVA